MCERFGDGRLVKPAFELSSKWWNLSQHNTPLFWRDENSKDAYLGSDFVLIEITDPKLYERDHLSFSGNAR